MKSFLTYLPNIVRYLLAALFLFSAYTKVVPLWSFEKQLVDLGLVNWDNAPYLARAIIGLEFAIGFLLLQKNKLRSFIIPITAFLLIAFCIHLSIEGVKHGFNNGNCGCFGTVIEMTPLEAIIKNVITLFLLAFLYFKVKSKDEKKDKFWILPLVYILALIGMFVIFPLKRKISVPLITPTVVDTLTNANVDTVEQKEVVVDLIDTIGKTKIDINKEFAKEPKKIESVFGVVKDFNGLKVNLDEGKKIICMFAAGCDHCQAAAKELGKLAKKGKLPPVYILFMNEEAEKIPEFFKIAKHVFPYTVLEIPTFWKILGTEGSTPLVGYLWNGNTIKSWNGTEKQAFKVAELVNVLAK